jgi:hypothetical protein
MAKESVIENRDCFAKIVGDRVWIAIRTKGGGWRGLTLDFKEQQRTWAPSTQVRSSSTAKEWVNGTAKKRPGGRPSKADEEF